MMYFTEGPGASEDPIKLHEEFEAKYDSDEYEAKISRLLAHAYLRLRKENHAARKNWDLAIRCLRRGDHYLLVMWDLAQPAWTPVRDSLKLFASALGVIALALLVVFIASKFAPQWRWLEKNIPLPNPHVLLGVFLALLVAGLFFQRPLGSALEWILDRRVFRFFLGPKESERDSE